MISKVVLWGCLVVGSVSVASAQENYFGELA